MGGWSGLEARWRHSGGAQGGAEDDDDAVPDVDPRASATPARGPQPGAQSPDAQSGSLGGPDPGRRRRRGQRHLADAPRARGRAGRCGVRWGLDDWAASFDWRCLYRLARGVNTGQVSPLAKHAANAALSSRHSGRMDTVVSCMKHSRRRCRRGMRLPQYWCCVRELLAEKSFMALDGKWGLQGAALRWGLSAHPPATRPPPTRGSARPASRPHRAKPIERRAAPCGADPEKK